MRKVLVAGIVFLSPLITLSADGMPMNASINSVHEHRINFGLLNLGYERIQSDSIYTGFDIKMASFLLNEKDKNKSLDHYVNGEVRLGYNHTLSEMDSLTAYGGVGFSVFVVEKEEGKLRNWNYATLGVKYLHQFGEIFEMGLNMKGFKSISQKRYEIGKAQKIESEIPDLFEGDQSLSTLPTTKFHNENDHRKTNFTAVNIDDSRFVMQIGIPMIWHVGANKNWEIQFEPYYMQIPNVDLTHIIGSNLAIGYRY